MRPRAGRGEIRRVNLNAAPLDHDGYATVKAAGIGTYQIFQETYHHETYRRGASEEHAQGRLSLAARRRRPRDGGRVRRRGHRRAVRPVRLAIRGAGPGEPRPALAEALQRRAAHDQFSAAAAGLRREAGRTYLVSDDDFKRLVAILRLSVPYTGLICTAREPPGLRREILAFGVSQIDAGSRVEIGGYTEAGDAQVMEREQFELGDIRPLDAVVRELLVDGYIPSFCTACYRLGRTGEQFMEFAIPGFIQNLCTPNALSTLMEYLIDYASPETREAGEAADPPRDRKTARWRAQAPTARSPATNRREQRAGFVFLSCTAFRIEP